MRLRRAAGFTLIETALTMVIVGTGILAMVSAQQAYHMKNDWAARTGTAQMLANEIRELTIVLPQHDPITGDTTIGPEANETGGVTDWDDLDDFAGTISAAGFGAGTTFNPPINGLRLPISDMGNWQQFVTVENVLPDKLNPKSADTLPLGSTEMVRVRVTVRYRPGGTGSFEDVTSLTWVVAD
jgi:hypothetical protein